MPRQCSVCVSEARVGFEASVASGTSVRAAAHRLGLPYPAAKRHARLHGRAAAAIGTVSAIATFSLTSGHAPMTWQRAILEETRDTILLKGRQIGASEVASVLAVHTALTRPGSTSAIVSPSQRQSSEVTVRARIGFWNLGETLRQDSATLLRTANGSRVVSLPGSACGIRGYAADLVVLDVAAWIPSEMFAAARPLTAATRGRLIIQSTPGSPVGAFHELATDPPEAWAFMKVRSDEMGTIASEFLERERAEMSPELYRQEYEAEFGTGGGGGLLDMEALRALVRTS